MIDPAALQMVLLVLTGWLDRREREAVAYLIEENRLLRRQLGSRRLRLTDEDRRRLAVRAYRVGRATLRQPAPVGIGELEPLPTQLPSKDAILFHQIREGLPLLAISRAQRGTRRER